ncbi:MAG: TonB-dependent receptor [Gemmatimonadota bacterium]
MSRTRTGVPWRVLLCGLGVAVLCPTGLTGQVPDTAATRDTTVYLIDPLRVTVERERSAPPPVAATVIAPERVRGTLARNPYQLLRRISSVDVHDQGQGPGFASNVVLRGFTSDHSSDVLLVVDGVPINLPAHGHVEGFADWNLLFPQAVSSMRLIHGGASPLYGDFALAGVVEVFTRADAEGTEASLETTSFGDVQGSALVGRRHEDGGFLVGGSVQREDGWRANMDYRLANALARGWRALGTGRLEGGLSLYGTTWNSPGFVTVPAYNAEDVRSAVDPSDGGDSRRIILHGRWSRPVGGARVMQATAWAQASDYSLYLHIPGHDHGGDAGTVLQSGEFDERVGGGGQVELGWTGARGDLVVGASGRAESVGYRHASTVQRAIALTETDLDATYRTAALYTRWRRTIAQRLGVDLGARVDRFTHTSRSNLDAAAALESSTRAIVSPKLGLRWAWTPQLTLKAGSSRGFRSPVGIIGDPAREPYIAWSHEVGAELRGDRFDAGMSLFRIDVSNERLLDPVTLEVTDSGGSTRQGIEAQVGWSLSEEVRLDLGVTLNDAHLHGGYVDPHEDHGHEEAPADGPNTGDDPVPGVSRYLMRAGAQLPLPWGLPMRMSWRLVGPHTPVGEPEVETRAYSLLDVGTEWEWRPGVTLEMELSNVADVRYVELRSSGFVTPGAPRSLSARVRVGTH